MKPVEIKKDIYWVGAIDWNLRNFHGHTYHTRTGTTYNAYLIIDEKVTLIDTVYTLYGCELIENIKQIIEPEKIDYIVANHVEVDHSGALPDILRVCPNAKLFGTAKCKEGLYKHYYGNWDFQTVKTGNKLKLGKRSLLFIEAAMIHWPDSMFTYCQEQNLLLPNDAFGQHYATSERFDDEADEVMLMDETARYYANILWPFSSIISRKLEEIKRLDIKIDMIAPSHGIIWRKNPQRAIDAYISWAGNETRHKVVVVFETMWGATEKMARAIVRGIMDLGIPVKLFDINQSDRTEIIKEMLDAKGFIIGSSAHDNDMLPTIAGFLEFLKGLKPKNRIALVFGSYGWGGGAVKEIENILKDIGIELGQSSLSIQYVPNETELAKCYEVAMDFAKRIK